MKKLENNYSQKRKELRLDVVFGVEPFETESSNKLKVGTDCTTDEDVIEDSHVQVSVFGTEGVFTELVIVLSDDLDEHEDGSHQRILETAAPDSLYLLSR